MAALNSGDKVRIVDGPYRGFQGTVKDTRLETGQVMVVVPVYGRQAALEFAQSQVERL
jgi:transcriptional antiterminator NusG